MSERKLLISNELKKWGNLDLNQGPEGYEGGGLPQNPILSNRYELDDKRFTAKMLLDFMDS
jgi:hypothetical protein